MSRYSLFEGSLCETPGSPRRPHARERHSHQGRHRGARWSSSPFPDGRIGETASRAPTLVGGALAAVVTVVAGYVSARLGRRAVLSFGTNPHTRCAATRTGSNGSSSEALTNVRARVMCPPLICL
ncbi:hypothetical protein MRX96_002567 [Rhipicephalus microplus]